MEVREVVDGSFKSSTSDILFTVSETAKLFKTNPATIYGLIKAGTLPALKLGCYKVRKKAIDEFLEKYEGRDITDPYDVKYIHHKEVNI